MGKPFTALFWNVWVESQRTPARLQLLKDRFSQIIDECTPDSFGLNEVVADASGDSPLLQHLEARGYHTFFAPFSPENDGRLSGSALVTRAEPMQVATHELGPDKYGSIRGFPGYTIKLIQARLPHEGQHINLVVNYLAHLVPWNWPAHIRHHKSFRKIVRLPELQYTTIIGGDFNQFKFMPRMWGAKSLYHRATGTLLHPTWKLIGRIPVIQANYDNIFWTKCGTLKLEEFKILSRHPSDHTPLIARFTVGQEPNRIY